MSLQKDVKRLTAPDIRARKGGDPIVMLTSYHAHTASLVDKYCDVILVGDSLGMVMHGLETTVPVTLDMMILQGHAVMRGSERALVVVDMPFGSYEASREQAELFNEEIGDRLDLTETTIITIDPVDARDFDDAISLEKLDNGHWRLGVHIADVSHFVQPRSALQEAHGRRRPGCADSPLRTSALRRLIFSSNCPRPGPMRLHAGAMQLAGIEWRAAVGMRRSAHSP